MADRRTRRTSVLFKANGRIAYAEHPDRVESLLASGVRRRTRYSAPTRRVLLSKISATLQDGIAVEREEHTAGWSCIASGIRDCDEHVVGIVGVIGHTGTWEPTRLSGPITRVSDDLSGAIALAAADVRRARERHPAG
jgi:DNA-binding IclR family transcriptional regulator